MANSFLLPASAIITVVLLCISPVPTFAGDFVLDIHGQQVVSSVDYYIAPQLYGTGGLIVTPRNTSLCPQYSIKQQVYSAGSPFSIAPVATSAQFLTTGLPVALYFTRTPPTCNNVLRWLVRPKTNSNDQSYVVVGADQGLFNSTYFFTIEQSKESKYGYNIYFCQGKQSNNIVGTLLTNNDVSLVNGQCNVLGFLNGLLGINPNEPFPFVFVKVTE